MFQSRDPWEGSGWNPSTLNYYTYSLNNPVIYVDPSGELCIFGFINVPGLPGSACSERAQQRLADDIAFLRNLDAAVRTPAFASGFVYEFVDSISVSSVSNTAGLLQLIIEETPAGQLYASSVGLALELCNLDADVTKALLSPYSTLVNNPDPRYQLGRWAGRLLALGVAGGEIGGSIGGELGAILLAPITGGTTGIAAIAAAPEAIAVASHGAAVIGNVIHKEAVDPLLSRTVIVFAEASEAASGDEDSLPDNPGEWGPRKGIGGAQYENEVRQHLGGPPDRNYYYNNTSFDGWNSADRAFVDAKDAPGRWYKGDPINPKVDIAREAKIIQEAQDQLDAAGPYSVQWWTNSAEAEIYLSGLFKRKGLNITVVGWP